MRKSTHIYYDTMDVQKIVSDELEKAKFAWIDAFTKVVEKFKDDVMTKLDKFVGEIDSYRKEQDITSQKLSEHSDQIEDLDARLKKFGHPSL